jgi:hypothetical protein
MNPIFNINAVIASSFGVCMAIKIGMMGAAQKSSAEGQSRGKGT